LTLSALPAHLHMCVSVSVLIYLYLYLPTAKVLSHFDPLIQLFLSTCVHNYMCIYVHVYISNKMWANTNLTTVHMYLCTHYIHMYICRHACTYVCWYVCMYISMLLFINSTDKDKLWGNCNTTSNNKISNIYVCKYINKISRKWVTY